MKLIIQIPCFNEAATLPGTLADLPCAIPGFDEVEILVVDDGSTDGTGQIARDAGVDHVLRFVSNRGLAAAFRAGLDKALALGADVIVNTDGDNQYPGTAIPELVRPIVDGEAELVVGVRNIENVPHFSRFKKRLQRAGSAVVRRFSGLRVEDATSGFRAFSRRAATRLNVINRYTYTLETLIQAGRQDLAVVTVPIDVNPKTRESRLIRSTPKYIWRSAITIVRMFITYEPLRALGSIAALLLGVGMLIGMRFVYFYCTEGGRGHVQSLILAAILIIIGFQTGVLGVLADLSATNRRLLEDLLARSRQRTRDDGS
ncbi:MAG: glycosyltransferase family 2 protein [Candidatus Lernaella stagnicola]|nr:glycosyltransferase family 2 protein [Candidatus Lernaella stagnicola]